MAADDVKDAEAKMLSLVSSWDCVDGYKYDRVCIAPVSGQVVACDTSKCRVLVLKSDGTLQHSFGHFDAAQVENPSHHFSSIVGLACTGNDEIVVGHSHGASIFTLAGELVRSIKDGYGNFSCNSLAADPQGNIFLGTNRHLTCFNSDGAVRWSLELDNVVALATDRLRQQLFVSFDYDYGSGSVDMFSFDAGKYTAFASLAETSTTAIAIAVAPQGLLYLVAHTGNCVLAYGPRPGGVEAHSKFKLGEYTCPDGETRFTSCAWHNDTLYVCDTKNRRLLFLSAPASII